MKKVSGVNCSKKKHLSALDIAVGEATELENWLYKLRDAGFLNADLANVGYASCATAASAVLRMVRLGDAAWIATKSTRRHKNNPEVYVVDFQRFPFCAFLCFLWPIISGP